jgi:NAD(P)-dependent dehydrogenase (short-subunit alcohol dehydrogenase family)
VAVITGGASGIGLSTALALAKLGCDVVIADIHAQRLEEAGAEIRKLGRKALAVSCDVTKDGDVNNLASRTMDTFGKVDILMCNAGVQVGGPTEKIPMSDWNWIMEINVLGVVRCVRSFVPSMIERKSGHIVITASMAGLFAHNGFVAPYITSKFAVLGFAESLVLYLRPKGIGVSVICPGLVRTHLYENVRVRDGSGSIIDRTAQIAATAQRKDIMGPEEVAQQTIDAIKENKFLVLTNPQTQGFLLKRVQDMEATIEERIRMQAMPGMNPGG